MKDIEAIVAKIARIPPKSVSKDDAETLRDLEASLKRVVFGQDKAIDALSSAIKLARAGLREPEKPIGNYLFAGPTGVGKTEVAKQLADNLGVELLRFDMSEYMEKHAVSRLIGAPPGYVGFDQGGLLTDGVDQHPHCVLLLDEIEKAHPDVFNILLQVMDHGELTDHNGRTVNFRNVVLIMTSNAGAMEQAKEAIGFGRSRREGEDTAAIERTFTPEFRNRLDAVINFAPLGKEVILQVVEKFVLQLEAQLLDRGVTIELTTPAAEWLADKGYDDKMGARPLGRVIQEHIKKPLAEELLFGKLTKGGIVKVGVKDGKIDLKVEEPKQARGSPRRRSRRCSPPTESGARNDLQRPASGPVLFAGGGRLPGDRRARLGEPGRGALPPGTPRGICRPEEDRMGGASPKPGSPVDRRRCPPMLRRMIRACCPAPRPRAPSSPPPRRWPASRASACRSTARSATAAIQQPRRPDAGPGAADFTCGPPDLRRPQRHRFRPALASRRCAAGVAVLAAAPGHGARAPRRHARPRHCTTRPADVLDGRDCGNGVVIDHGGGWETQYCHLREGSSRRARATGWQRGGARARSATRATPSFRMSHLSVRRDGAVVDPFNTDGITVCGGDDGPDDDLWATTVRLCPRRARRGGFSTAVPAYDAIKAGTAASPALPADAPALVGWALSTAAGPATWSRSRLTGPDGGRVPRPRGDSGEAPGAAVARRRPQGAARGLDRRPVDAARRS